MQSNYPGTAGLGNIQCENCHGPGSEHADAFGNTNAPGWPRITVTTNSGDCNQCHGRAHASHQGHGMECSPVTR